MKIFYSTPNRSMARMAMTFKSPAPLITSDRDFYLQELTRHDFPQKGDISIYTKSLPDHPEYPVNPYRVRA